MSERPSHRHTNRLAKETSPYLLQHAHNPVDWYAWGPEAFEAARAQNKPIFLSVGYSTCYWCHVMERQSFENDAIAAEMNARFINIKVDREERPDVDQLYMLAVQVLTRQGGWPMSVFLTPDLRPFFGGTYFPPSDMYGRPGFTSVLKGIEDAYRNRPADVEKTANQLVEILGGMSGPVGVKSAFRIDADYVNGLIERSVGDYEPRFGGFGDAPKFPRETLLEMILVSSAKTPAPGGALTKVLHALDAMSLGGIRDQLGGGFHRYSTDAKWLVPHFEIMLYDNAMLGWVYAEAFKVTGRDWYADVARGIFDFILREMTSPAGLFYTAMDAEVDGQEGLNYLWTSDEIEEILGPDDADLFNKVYGVDEGPNFADPHHGNGTPEKNILFIADAELLEKAKSRVESMRSKLKKRRDARKQPLLDTKIITSWNALMIRALAHGGSVLSEPRYVEASAKAASELLHVHRTPDGGLFRTSRDGAAKYAGFLDDYAFLVQAMLELSSATGDAKWKTRAGELAKVMMDRFGDSTAGGFFFTEANAKDLIIRQKTASDSPLPSGNAIAALALMELGMADDANKVLQAFAGQLDRGAEGMSSMVQAAWMFVDRHGPIDVAPSRSSDEVTASPEQIASAAVGLRAKWASDRELRVQVGILDGFHLNAHDAGKGLVATTLAISGIDASVIEAIDYPAGEMRKFPFADEAIAVYEDSVEIMVRFREAAQGKKLSVRLTYQACDESACLAPISKSIDVQ